MTQLTATFTVTIKTKPDGDYYFDHDDLVRNAVPWIEGGLDDRDDIAEVTITEQPAAVSAPAGQTTLRDRIAAALTAEHYRRAEARIVASPEEHCAAMADAVLAVLPEPTDRAAVRAAALREAADRYALLTDQNEAYDREQGELNETARLQHGTVRDVVAGLRRMADETATETPTVPVQHAPGKAIRCPDCRAKGYTVCLDEPAAGARQDGAQGTGVPEPTGLTSDHLARLAAGAAHLAGRTTGPFDTLTPAEQAQYLDQARELLARGGAEQPTATARQDGATQ